LKTNVSPSEVKPADARAKILPTNGRVLVVEDEPALLRSIQRTLAARGYFVDSAPNGADAAALFSKSESEFDIIISDIAMPGMDGIQLLKSVREHDADIPVVLITGEPSVTTAVKALEYGAFNYLTKPVDNCELESVVERATYLRRMAMMKRKAAEILGTHPASDNRIALTASFERALGSLWMAYQPIVNAKNGEVYGYEALLRSGEESLPHPGAVLDAAERLGRLDELGRAIRERSGQAMTKAPDQAALFVNLHTTDLLDPSLINPDSPLSQIASRVVLEITERASLDQVKDVRTRVAQLREMGFRIAVDDLGAGYAGLTSFALLEPEIVKLDMTLVRDVHLNETKQKLIRSMATLCKDMRMMVVAEGVEIKEERDTLISLGCDLLQGYLISRPDKPFPQVAW
jgi:EAL domain-containing protein (putative c-di-GMP-specific phosphodiesterase class I)